VQLGLIKNSKYLFSNHFSWLARMLQFTSRTSCTAGEQTGISLSRGTEVNIILTKAKITLAIAALFSCMKAQADWSANIGWASDYFYRGILQAPSSASGGVDFEAGGFYAGTWAADVNDGLEVDGYFGYAKEISGIDVGLGFTGYYYTGNFDDTYQEINFSTGYGLLTLDYALGEYQNFDGPTRDYGYYALTVAKDGFYARLAGFQRDLSGEYVEIGYDVSLSEIDLGFKAILSNAELTGSSDESLVFTVGKTFDF
jgi:uncharacterized protein (TIGR02001 family)